VNSHGLTHVQLLSFIIIIIIITGSLIVSTIIVCTTPSHAHIEVQQTPALQHLQCPLHAVLRLQWRRYGAGFDSKISPVRFPSLACRVQIPSPFIEIWDILLDSGCLIPVEAGLQQCSFDVLNKCSLGGRQVLVPGMRENGRYHSRKSDV